MGYSRWYPAILAVVLALASLAWFARLTPAKTGDQGLSNKEQPLNDELFKLLKTHFSTGRARSVASRELPAVLAKPMKTSPDAGELRRFCIERYNGILAMNAYLYDSLELAVEGNDIAVLSWSRLLLQAGLEIHEQPKARVSFLNQMVEYCRRVTLAINMRELEHEKANLRLGWRVFTLEVQIALLRAEKVKTEK